MALRCLGFLWYNLFQRVSYQLDYVSDILVSRLFSLPRPEKSLETRMRVRPQQLKTQQGGCKTVEIGLFHDQKKSNTTRQRAQKGWKNRARPTVPACLYPKRVGCNWPQTFFSAKSLPFPPPSHSGIARVYFRISCHNGLSRKVYFYPLVYKLRDLVKLTSLPFTEVPKVQWFPRLSKLLHQV